MATIVTIITQNSWRMLSRMKLAPRSFGRQISAFQNFHCNAYASRIRLANPVLVQRRGIRTKPETLRLKTHKDGPTAGEKVLMQRMLEQRQVSAESLLLGKLLIVPLA